MKVVKDLLTHREKPAGELKIKTKIIILCLMK